MVSASPKAPQAYRTISEVADELHVPQHVLRFWETRFEEVRPLKRGGGRRYYRLEDVALLQKIAGLLYVQGYTINGVRRLLKERGNNDHPSISPSLISSDVSESPALTADAAESASEDGFLRVPEGGALYNDVTDVTDDIAIASSANEGFQGSQMAKSSDKNLAKDQGALSLPASSSQPPVVEEYSSPSVSDMKRLKDEVLALRAVKNHLLAELKGIREELVGLRDSLPC